MAAKRAAIIRCLRVVSRMPRWLMVALIAVIIPLGTVVAVSVTRPKVAHAASGYLLPYPGGWLGTVNEGNNTGDHTGLEAWAWNFNILNGRPAVAAHGGTVTQIKQDSNTSCYDSSCKDDANYVVIDQGDGTQALYLHLQLNGARVTVGEQVTQGEIIGFPGNTGDIYAGGLEFMVEQYSGTNWYAQSLPITFDDVSGGVPITSDSYTSGNYSGGGTCLNAPTLNSPVGGTSLSQDTVNFSWGPASGCSLGSVGGYTLRINQSSDPNASPIVDTSVDASAPTYNYTFGWDGVYWWHVRTCAPCTPANPGAWSNSSFAIDTSNAGAPDAPALQSPGYGISVSSATVTFSWSPSDSPNVTGYKLHISTSSTIDGSGAPLIVDTGVDGTSYTYTFSQDYSELWWSVAALNTTGQQGSFAPAGTFAVNTSVPGAPDSPALQSPADGTFMGSTVVTFSWSPSDSPNVTSYILHATGPGATVQLNTTVSGTTFTARNLYEGDYTLTWSVAAVNASNQQGGFSKPQTVTFDVALPSLLMSNPSVGEWGVAPCYDNVLTFQATVYAGYYLTSVDFRRADPVTNLWVELGHFTGLIDASRGAIFKQALDCSTLPYFWNQIWVSAINEVGVRTTEDFWVYRYPPAVAPTALAAQAASCSEVDLSWADNSGGQDGFNIYRDGALVGQVGQGTSSFQDIGLSAETTYIYTLTATSGALESSSSNKATVATPACPPPPTVSFIEPVGDGGTALCTDNGTVMLQVSATSTIGISSVQFYRYDPVSGLSIALDTTASAPYYGATVGCRGLVHGWNLVYVFAFDTTDNATFDFAWIYLPRPQAGSGEPGSGNCADLPRGC